MSTYITEEEQLEAIKKWWKKYQTLLTSVLTVVLLLIAGYRYWDWHVEKVNQQASNAYERLMVAVSQKDIKAIRAYAKQLSTHYRQTIYGDVARLSMAHYFVTHDHVSDAREALTYVVDHSKMPALRQIASIRLARILLSEKAYDQALFQLDKINEATYLPLVNELKGDVLVAMGHKLEAKKRYQEAMLDVKTRGVANPFLEMKLNDNE